jgi:hypothetical protein
MNIPSLLPYRPPSCSVRNIHTCIVEKYSLREKEWACSVNNNTHNSPDILVTLCRKYRKRPTFFDIVPPPLPRPLAKDMHALPAVVGKSDEFIAFLQSVDIFLKQMKVSL